MPPTVAKGSILSLLSSPDSSPILAPLSAAGVNSQSLDVLDLDLIVVEAEAEAEVEVEVVLPRRKNPKQRPAGRRISASASASVSASTSSPLLRKRKAAATGPPSKRVWRDPHAVPVIALDSDSVSGDEADSDSDNPDYGIHNPSDIPSSSAPRFSISALIDSIPLVDRAPVGRRRLVRGKDILDGEDGGVMEEGMSFEEQIESDGVMIREAARRLACKRTWVETTRREEVFEDGGVKREEGEDEDEEMKLRRPGEREEVRGREKAKEKEKRAPGINDDMEWVQGADLGQRDKGRRFKDVVERKLMWRVPGMHTPLLEHQVLGVDWMVMHEMSDAQPRGGLVADAMGLGKTIQAIAAMVINPPPPAESATDPTVTLIVVPVALIQQWALELRTHAKSGNFSIHVHHGATKLQSVSALRHTADVIITSYATVMHSYPSPRKPKRMTAVEADEWWDEQWRTRGILHRVKFWRVILDEAHMIKNRAARTSLACQGLSALHTWCLTGTPIQNALVDIFPLLRFLRHPHVSCMDAWRALVGSGAEGEGAAKRVQAVLRGCMMRRNKKDQLLGRDLVVLPKMWKRMVEVEFTEEERELYTRVEDEMRSVLNRWIGEGAVMKNYGVVLVMLLRLRQICDHPALVQTSLDLGPATPECALCHDAPEAACTLPCKHVFCHDCISTHLTLHHPPTCPTCHAPTPPNPPPAPPISRTWTPPTTYSPSSKTTALLAQLSEWHTNHPREKVVLFSQFTRMLDIIELMLTDADLCSDAGSVVRYTGAMTLPEREEALSAWRAPDGWCLLVSLRAGGVGLNLVEGCLVGCLDLWWNAAVELQAFDRVHRMGQKKEVHLSRFIVRDTVEQRIMALQERKQGLANAALGDGVGTKLGRLTERELVGLFGCVVDGPGGVRVVADGPGGVLAGVGSAVRGVLAGVLGRGRIMGEGTVVLD